MKTRNGFILLEKDEVRAWIADQPVERTVTEIQNHHTYLPDYTSFERNRDHFKWLDSMKQYHVVNNGWSDIAQNLTTFPDGSIAVCRPVSKSPAGIKGHNAQGICIEHLGNFDKGHDAMTPEHRKAIVHLNAVLCEKFRLEPGTDTIVYHHWFHEKTCPGTDFFGGNTRETAVAGFVPLVRSELAALKNESPGRDDIREKAIGYGLVKSTSLNIRKGPSAYDAKCGALHQGNRVTIFQEKKGWFRISHESKWVSRKYITIVYLGKVTADSLNVRTGPGTGYRVTGSLAKDTEVTLYETENGWHRIGMGEEWVSGKYIQSTE